LTTKPPSVTDDQLHIETEELRRLVTVAGLNLEAWLALHTTPNWRVQNTYIPYFQTAVSAHFASMVMAFYCLYETNPKSTNIPGVLRQLRATSRLPEVDLDQLDKTQADLKHLWVKISVLRNKVFGHREREITIDDVFKQAGLRPNDFETLFDETARLLNEVTRALFKSAHALNLGAKQAVMALHEDIERAYPTKKEKP
jgi:hypothetical protein